MKVLVTGGAGNGGSATSRAVLKAGFAVRIAVIVPPAASDQLTDAEVLR